MEKLPSYPYAMVTRQNLDITHPGNPNPNITH